MIPVEKPESPVMIIPYDSWNGTYDILMARMKYADFEFYDRGISEEEIEDTLTQASQIVTDFRGVIAGRERIKTLILAILAAIFLLLAVITGMTGDSFFWPTFIVILYIIIYICASIGVKYFSSYQLRMSQFLVSVLCRAENNKVYLKNGVEVRPGFLGSWIEFRILENRDMNVMIQ